MSQLSLKESHELKIALGAVVTAFGEELAQMMRRVERYLGKCDLATDPRESFFVRRDDLRVMLDALPNMETTMTEMSSSVAAKMKTMILEYRKKCKLAADPTELIFVWKGDLRLMAANLRLAMDIDARFNE